MTLIHTVHHQAAPYSPSMWGSLRFATYRTKQLYMASQQVNGSTTSQVAEAQELNIL